MGRRERVRREVSRSSGASMRAWVAAALAPRHTPAVAWLDRPRHCRQLPDAVRPMYGRTAAAGCRPLPWWLPAMHSRCCCCCLGPLFHCSTPVARGPALPQLHWRLLTHTRTHLARVGALCSHSQHLLQLVPHRVTEHHLRQGANRCEEQLDKGRCRCCSSMPEHSSDDRNHWPQLLLLTIPPGSQAVGCRHCCSCSSATPTLARGAPRPESWMISLTTPLM